MKILFIEKFKLKTLNYLSMMKFNYNFELIQIGFNYVLRNNLLYFNKE